MLDALTINLPTKPDAPSWYQVHPEIRQLLLAAVATWEDTDRSERFILQALAHPAAHLDVLVSAYRYFFYKHNNCMARRLALQVMERIRQEESLPEEWERLQPILKERLSDTSIRLYLNAYTALGMMLARWGAFQAAIEISRNVQSIDERDVFGAKIILNILTQEDE